MTRRGALALPLALAACAGPPVTLVEVIDAGTMPLPIGPGLIVPDVALPTTAVDREAAMAEAREALLRGIGERPRADPAPDALLVPLARAKGLARVVRMTVTRASVTRSGLFGRETAEAAIRVRVTDAATGWVSGDATFLRRSRAAETLPDAIATLAAGLLA